MKRTINESMFVDIEILLKTIIKVKQLDLYMRM